MTSSNINQSASAQNAEACFSPAKPLSIPELEAVAKRVRRSIVTMISQAGSGHPGGSLSAVEIVTTLYFHTMKHRPLDCHWPERDRFVLSKGHAAPLLYAVLAEEGYIPVSELATLRQIGSRLQGHTECRLVPGIEMSAGALGQGLSFSIGAGLAARLNNENHRIYVLLGDGECDEGQVWEAAMAASNYKLDNLTAIVDNNGIQLVGWNKDIMNLEPFGQKWAAFGWNVIEVDGHNFAQLISAFDKA
jgi:transketolase